VSFIYESTGPFGAGVRDHWTAWEVKVLDRQGDPLDSDPLYSRELVRNGAGIGLFEQSQKETAAGQPAFNVGYRIPRPSVTMGWQSIRWDEEGESDYLLTEESLDVEKLDYLYFYVLNSGALDFELELRSAAGRRLRVAPVETLTAGREGVAFWSFASNENRWLPNSVDPEIRLSLAHESFSKDVGVRAVCVHDLRSQGWDEEAIAAIRLVRSDSSAQEIQVSSLFTLGRPDGQAFYGARPARRFISQVGESGFQRGRVVPLEQTALEEEAEQDTQFSITAKSGWIFRNIHTIRLLALRCLLCSSICRKVNL